MPSRSDPPCSFFKDSRLIGIALSRTVHEWSDDSYMTVVVALVLCAVLGGGSQARTHGKESVRIYVFATEVPGGSPPGDALQGRLAAVRELRDALRRRLG